MSRVLTILLLWLIFSNTCSQNYSFGQSGQLQFIIPPHLDTLNSFFVKKHPPYLFTSNLHHKESTLCNKLIRANFYVMGYNIAMGAYLAVCPEYISKWNKKEKFQMTAIIHQYHESFTKPPVFDKDLFIVNYLGHPYQGGYYYNALRSQGADVWQSSLFCLGQSFLWEYGWEAGMEQPSIQDLFTTPLLGILAGELSHVATIKMSRNGFRWYEIGLVCLINPVYAINNGFKFR
jgi:hypothetical protein